MAAVTTDAPNARFDGTLPAWVEARRPPLEQRLEVLASAAELVAQMHGRAGGADRAGACRDLGPDCLQIHEDEAGPHVGLARGARPEAERLARPEGVSDLALSPFAPIERQLPTDVPAEPSADVHALAAIGWLVLTGGYPAALGARQAALLPEARELIELHLLGEDRNEVDNQRFAELRALSLDHFFLGEDIEPLSEVDRALFKAALVGLLRDRSSRADAVAAEVATILLPELERALAPEPSERLDDARRLGDALRRAASAVEAGVEAPVLVQAPAAAPPVVAAPAAPPAPAPSPPAPVRGSRLPVVVVLVGVAILAAVFLLRPGKAPTQAPTTAPPAPAPAVPALPPTTAPSEAPAAPAEAPAAPSVAPAAPNAPATTAAATAPAATRSTASAPSQAGAASSSLARKLARETPPDTTGANPDTSKVEAALAATSATSAPAPAAPAEPAGPPTSLKLKITMADGSKPAVYLDGATVARSFVVDPGRQHAVSVQNVDGAPCNFAVRVSLDGEVCTWTLTTARGTFDYKSCEAASVQCDDQGNIRQP